MEKDVPRCKVTGLVNKISHMGGTRVLNVSKTQYNIDNPKKNPFEHEEKITEPEEQDQEIRDSTRMPSLLVISQFKGFIAIEGNIGAGKSTLIRRLKRKFDKQEKEYAVYFAEEPVDTWVLDGILQWFYDNPKDNSIGFQMCTLNRFIEQRKNVSFIMEIEKKPFYIITERSPYSDKMFVKTLNEMNMFDKRLLSYYDNLWEYATRWVRNKQIASFYLETDPLICKKRISKRDREGEKVGERYLINLKRNMDKMFKELIDKEIMECYTIDSRDKGYVDECFHAMDRLFLDSL